MVIKVGYKDEMRYNRDGDCRRYKRIGISFTGRRKVMMTKREKINEMPRLFRLKRREWRSNMKMREK